MSAVTCHGGIATTVPRFASLVDVIYFLSGRFDEILLKFIMHSDRPECASHQVAVFGNGHTESSGVCLVGSLNYSLFPQRHALIYVTVVSRLYNFFFFLKNV